MVESALEGDARREGGAAAAAGFLKDEMGANTSLSVLDDWSHMGERAYCSVAPNRGKNTTTLVAASMCVEGMGPSPLAVEGATDGEVFEAYVEKKCSLGACGRRGRS